MPPRCQFLDLAKPPLEGAIEVVARRFLKGNRLDLVEAVIVLPTSRAKRRFKELLVARCEKEKWVLVPPAVETVGKLPELLYSAKRKFASPMAQELAWARAVRSLPEEVRKALLSAPPAREDDLAWLDLGRLLGRLHASLAGELPPPAKGAEFDFEQVAEQLAADQPREAERWKILALAEKKYLALLDSLQLWDPQAARRKAVELKECRADRHFFLLGLTDINLTLRRMLDQAAQQGNGSITLLVPALAEWSNRFDSHGQVLPEAWEEATLDVDLARVHVVGNPTDQGAETLRVLADWKGRYHASEITIGLPDESLAISLERQLRERGVPARYGPGRSARQGNVARLLHALADYLDGSRFVDFAALLRQKDIDAWLTRQVDKRSLSRYAWRDDWISDLDEYRGTHLSDRISAEWMGDAEDGKAIRAAAAQLKGLLSELRGPEQPLDLWAYPIRRFLTDLLAGAPLQIAEQEGRDTERGIKAVAEAIAGFSLIPSSLMPKVNAAEALRIVVAQVERGNLPPPAEANAIELVGWLELPLDDAPALIVTSLNESFVPQAVNADLFLPNGLRSRLGLDDNARRYARDAYALSVLLKSGRDVHLLLSRSDAEGNPLSPSRLLLAASPEVAAKRILDLLDRPLPPTLARRPAGLPPPLPHSLLEIPRPVLLEEKTPRFSVTALRAFLECPYRFYLSRMLQLTPLDDLARELDPGNFGTLLHEVLGEFGKSKKRDSSDASTIRRVLDDLFEQEVQNRFGQDPAAPVQLQLHQLRERLRAFAECQAKHVAEGWRIHRVEEESDRWEATFQVGKKKVILVGRIDRIDFNERMQRFALLDYKSADNSTSPGKAHRKQNGEWVDFQLPLYRHLARAAGIEGPFELGYIHLPARGEATGFDFAKWSEGDLEGADSAAIAILERILAGEFWPPQDLPADYDDFAWVCQSGVFGRARPLLEEMGEEAS